MKRDIPHAFRFVTLSNRNTWENSTLEEWVCKRQELLKKREHSGDLRAHWVEYIRAYSEANKRVKEEDKEAGRRHRGPLSGRQRARIEEILKDEFFTGRTIPVGFNDWEREFLLVSDWLDEFLNGEPCSNPWLANKLFWWLLDTEASTGLTKMRRECLARRQESVAPTADPGRRMPRKKNPFLPHPLELIWIHRCSVQRLSELKRIIETATKFGIEPDDYEAEYPCPICNRKYDAIRNARKCCQERLSEEDNHLLQKYAQLFGLGGPGHQSFLSDFLAMIWAAGYETIVTVEDIMDWSEWSSFEDTQLFEFVHKFVGFLFAAEPDTIRRKMTKKQLTDFYEHFGVAEGFRFYLDRSLPGAPFMLSPREWFLNLDDEGVPTAGPTCFPLSIPDKD